MVRTADSNNAMRARLLHLDPTRNCAGFKSTGVKLTEMSLFGLLNQNSGQYGTGLPEVTTRRAVTSGLGSNQWQVEKDRFREASAHASLWRSSFGCIIRN